LDTYAVAMLCCDFLVMNARVTSSTFDRQRKVEDGIFIRPQSIQSKKQQVRRGSDFTVGEQEESWESTVS